MTSKVVRYLLILVLLILILESTSCYKSRPSSRPSRPSWPSRPSPTYRPYPRPSPTYRPFPQPSPTHRPFPTRAPTYRPFPSPTYKPFPSNPATFKPFPTHSPTSRPFPTHSPTYRPFPAQPTYRPYPSNPNYPTSRPNYPTSRPNYGTKRYPTQPQRYPTQPVGPRPSYPGYTGGGTYTHYQPSYSVPIRVPSSGGTKVKVYNIHNYRPSSYWAPPSYPVYHYTYRDTGSSALGFYLGYSLGHLSHPTYYHHSHQFYDGYSPRYDHYTVHHYYHNSASVPKEQTVTSKVIIQCGDGSKICPANTTALCTANGQIMCVVVASNTVPCQDNTNLRCVKSMVPCENNEAPECKGVAKGQLTSIDIPCISKTVIEGNITTINNTIVSTDLKNTTLSKEVVATTLPTVVTTLPNSTFPSLGSRSKREVPQYCVTVLAEPSQRVPTEGEQVFKEVSSVFDKFFAKAFGMDKVKAKPTVADLGN